MICYKGYPRNSVLHDILYLLSLRTPSSACCSVGSPSSSDITGSWAAYFSLSASPSFEQPLPYYVYSCKNNGHSHNTNLVVYYFWCLFVFVHDFLWWFPIRKGVGEEVSGHTSFSWSAFFLLTPATKSIIWIKNSLYWIKLNIKPLHSFHIYTYNYIPSDSYISNLVKNWDIHV